MKRSQALTLLLLLFSLGSCGRSQRFCNPGAVQDITLDKRNSLHWSTVINPRNCSLSAYIIDIFDSEFNTQLQLQAATTVSKFDVGFLDMCKSYTFQIRAITSERVLGPSARVKATTKPSADMDLRIDYTRITSNATELNIAWQISNSTYSRCVSSYRVIYWDGDDTPVDVYVSGGNFQLPNPVPCMAYKVQVNAIASSDFEGPMKETTVTVAPVVPSAPKLLEMITTSTAVNLVWKVPAYTENRCNLTELDVVTIGEGVTKKIVTISDSPARPLLKVTVKGLSPDNVYQSFVSLWNTAGSSKNVTVSYQASDGFLLKYSAE
ncbi:uncharacterized protein [Euwallacea fornicatus]|uniref:uncharacterized protein n=1 Tax=Euwallacea fornicatus TaxID=995702 RepID=UPI00338E8086